MKHLKIYEDLLKKQSSGVGRLSDLKEVKAKLALSYTNLLKEENNLQDAIAMIKDGKWDFAVQFVNFR